MTETPTDMIARLAGFRPGPHQVEGVLHRYVVELLDRQAAALAREANLMALLFELHAIVKGECPSLLNGDSGGNDVLDLDIRAALEVKP